MNDLYIGKNIVTSMQVDSNDFMGGDTSEMPSAEPSPETGSSDAGFAPISPETPSWGPPASSENNENNNPGFAPISPETPSWGPPASSENNENNNPGFAPISPETPSWGPPASSENNNTNMPGFVPISPETPSWGSSSGTVTIPCPSCGTGGWTVSPIVVVPGMNRPSGTGISNARFLYAATGQSPVNIQMGNRTVINRMQFGNSTPYYQENAGYQSILITDANTGRTMFRGIYYFNNASAYTFAIVNNGSAISLMQLTDMPCMNRNAACVRAVNLSSNSGPVDIFLTGAGRVFQNVDTFGITSYRPISQGSYRASVSEALPCTNSNAIVMAGSYVECSNTRIAVLDSVNVSFMAGVSYTLYLIGLAYQLPAAQLLSLESDLVY